MNNQPAVPPDPLIGQLIQGRYRVERLLGQGGMGRVYLAEQVSLKRPIALKVLRDVYAQDGEFVARFQREAEQAAKLNHACIVTIHEFGHLDKGGFFIAMEYVPGPTLDELLKNERLTVPRALRIGIQIAEGLQAAHQAGVVHRDVKPTNIIVQNGDVVKLVDFGIAQARDSQTHLTHPGQAVGTPKYMAPEQWGVGTVSAQTDLYALGIVLYEMLSGRAPFSAPTPVLMRMHLEEQPPPLRPLQPDIPPSVEHIVLQALEKQSEQRQRNMGELIVELQAALESRDDEETELLSTDQLGTGDSSQASPVALVEPPLAPQPPPEPSPQPLPPSPPPAPAAQTNKWRRFVLGLGIVLGVGILGLLASQLIDFSRQQTLVGNGEQQRQEEARRQAEAERQRQEREAAEAERKRAEAEQRRQAEVAHQRRDRSMVTVPAGPFWMGCNEKADNECFGDETPGREVQVAAFQIDTTELTAAAYRACVDAGRCSRPNTDEAACTWDQSGKEQYPVNCVDWEQAKAYCQWAGKRLPTEAEWEKAARGTDGRKYPWGNQGYQTAKRVANIMDEAAKKSEPGWTIAEGYDDGYYQTAPVGRYPNGAAPNGALDMVGNVYEWTSDWYDSERTSRSVRGGAWDSYPGLARASLRLGGTPARRDDNLGFRCAQ